jgi:hypothetical protein
MKRNSYLFFLVFAVALLTGCRKSILEPDIEGTWIQIDDKTNQNPVGCELTVSRSSGEVSLCGTLFVHPYNVVALGVPEKAKLFARDGQIWYKQKRADFLFIPLPGKEEHYFLDYEFDGDFLWVIHDDSDSFVSAKDNGMLFKRQ